MNYQIRAGFRYDKAGLTLFKTRIVFVSKIHFHLFH